MDFLKALQQAINKKHRKAGTRAYFSSGEIYFSRLYGYRLIGDRYEPDERYAPAITTIIKMLASRKSLVEVKQLLDNSKARDSSNNKYGLSKIMGLVRPVYAGYIEQHGRLVQIKNITPIATLDEYRKASMQVRKDSKRLLSQG